MFRVEMAFHVVIEGEQMGELVDSEEPSGLEPARRATSRLLLDNDAIRITYFDFGPGQANEWHFHPYDFVVVTFDDGTLQSQLTDGSTATIAAKQNNYYKVPAGNRHRAMNVGDTPIRLVEVELKNTDITKVGAGGSTAANGSARALPTLAEQITLLEEQRRAAMLAGDVDTLRDLLGEGMTYTHSDALRDTRASYLAKVASGALRYHELTIDDPQVLCVGTDTVLTTGRMRGRVDVNGNPRRLDACFTTTWLRAQGFWKLVSFQSTPVPNRDR